MKIYYVIIFLNFASCSSENKDYKTSQNTKSDTLLTDTTVTLKPRTTDIIKDSSTAFEDEILSEDTETDYETFEDYLACFEESDLPLTIDSFYLRNFNGYNSKRLKVSRFFNLPDLKEPKELNAFYAGGKVNIGNDKIAVAILTDIAPEFVGPDGQLKTVNIVLYDKNGKILNERTAFRFYNVFLLMEFSWGTINENLTINKSYYNCTVDDDTNKEEIERGLTTEIINF